MYSVRDGSGYSIDYSEWSRAGFPMPQEVRRFPRDEFCSVSWSLAIYYYGPSWSGQVN
jgi:hypothetical protein